jgi:microcystin-dependent protein
MAVLKYWDGSAWQSVGFATAWLPGDLKMSFRSTAPDGWLICDGSLVSQETYADLFAAIGHTANDGNDPGGGNFKLPDLRQRYPLGKAASGTGATLAGTGGSNDAVVVSHTHIQNAHSHTQDAHDHTQAVHNHGVTDPGHEHAIDGDYGNRVAVTVASSTHKVSTTGNDQSLDWSDIDANPTGISIDGAQPAVNGNTATNQSATASNQAQGVSATGANMPAFQVVNMLIKW